MVNFFREIFKSAVFFTLLTCAYISFDFWIINLMSDSGKQVISPFILVLPLCFSLFSNFMSSVLEGWMRSDISHFLIKVAQKRIPNDSELLIYEHFLQREGNALAKFVKSFIEFCLQAIALIVMFILALNFIPIDYFLNFLSNLWVLSSIFIILVLILIISFWVGKLRAIASMSVSSSLKNLRTDLYSLQFGKATNLSINLLKLRRNINLLAVAQGLRSVIKQFPSSIVDVMVIVGIISLISFEKSSLDDGLSSSRNNSEIIVGYVLLRIKAYSLKTLSSLNGVINFFGALKSINKLLE